MSAENEAARIWRSMAELSQGFEEQALLASPYADPPFTEGHVADALGALAADRDHNKVVRMLDVTIEGRRSPALKPMVVDDPPGPGEEPAAWAKRVFGDRPFSVMLNAVERWSEPLARAAAEFFAPAREAFGVPQQNYRISLFLGNYGFTPSGVHRDIGRSERVFHYNLGPGRKGFYSWPVEDYVAATGSTRPSFDPEPLLDRADGHTMEPGDLLLLNVSRYHVGHSAELSATLGLEMSKAPAAEIARDAAAAALGDLLKAGDDPVRPLDFRPEPVDYTDLSWARLPGTGVAEWLGGAVSAHVDRLRSNLGLAEPPMPLEGVDEERVADSALRIAGPFPLVLREQGRGSELYVRGRRIGLPADPALPELVARLSTGEEAAAGDLLPPGEPDRRRALRLLTALVRLRGVDARPLDGA
ncbi:hypothetical protein [Nocardiopsis composta]|uniref:Uncharacterized protein n=1 Tax=Nocardiopsis composta TaxID=157465 RepID=A0A7W8VD26_9ACTN|nr:hypothetical protein [Nocardiopsis composta]MBB5431590.1 hypothetical protein [Nocardiopsis composta]